MTYFISDIHGEYDLFLILLDKIGYSNDDIVFILGDMIDKGNQSIKLVDFISKQPNMQCIFGNHEYDFLKYYNGLMRSYNGGDISPILHKLQAYFPLGKDDLLSFETIDFIECLPTFIETDNFIVVHSGVQTDKNGIILPMKDQKIEYFVYNRRFKDDDFYLKPGQKTVLFGHTPCSYKNNSGKFIKTLRTGVNKPQSIMDYSKIQLDCGVYLTGLLGALCLETMEEFYVNKL